MIADPEALVARRLFALTRAELDAEKMPCGPYLEPYDAVASLDTFRITRLSSFWEREDASAAHDDLPSRIDDVVSGLSGSQSPWGFVIRGSLHAVACGYGVGDEAQGRAFESALTGADIVAGWNPFDDGWNARRATTVNFTGIPTRKADHLERLSRALAGSNWLYMVYAHPFDQTTLRAESIELERELSSVRQANLYDGSAPRASAERLVDLLQSQAKRYERARTLGLWNVYCSLSIDEPHRLSAVGGLLRGAFAGKKSVPEPVRVRSSGTRDPDEPNTWTLLTTPECATLATPLREDQPGFEIVPDTRFGVQSEPRDDGRVEIGAVIDRNRPTGGFVSVAMRDLTKHGLIVGVTGAGKTNTCFELLAQAWREGDGVPFMVLESAKSEYRDLIGDPRFSGVRVYTIGNETVSPIRMNPFKVASGVLVQSHIDFLKALFSAAFVLYPPMPYVLDQALHEIYEDFGWDLVTNTNKRGSDSDLLFPTLDDLVEKTKQVVAGLGYDKRLEMDVQAGLVARLDGLRRGGGKGPMLNTRSSISDADLFEQPCVLELKALVTDEEKAFFIGLVLIRLHEYYESRPHRHDGGLRHLTLIEEAHRLLRNVSTEQGSDVSANPKGQAVEVFGNMLAEIRAYGEGVLIAEQVPTKLLPDAIKNTNLKIVHRLVAKDDRDVVGETMNLDEDQHRFLTTLRTGEAVAYYEGMRKPTLIRVGLANVKRSGGRVSDAEVARTNSATVQRRSKLNPAVIALAQSVVSALRFGEDVVQRHLIFFRAAEANNVHEPLNALAEYVRSFIVRHALLHGWSVLETESIVAEAATAILALPDAQMSSVLSTRFAKLDHRDAPFPGCAECRFRCQLRFDVGTDVNDEFRNAYNKAFSGPADNFNERWLHHVVNPIIDRMAKTLATNTTAITKGAAYCFAVQNLAKVTTTSRELDVALNAFRQGIA